MRETRTWINGQHLPGPTLNPTIPIHLDFGCLRIAGSRLTYSVRIRASVSEGTGSFHMHSLRSASRLSVQEAFRHPYRVGLRPGHLPSPYTAESDISK